MSETLNAQFTTPEQGAQQLTAAQHAHATAEIAGSSPVSLEGSQSAELGTEADRLLNEPKTAPPETAKPVAISAPAGAPEGFIIRDKRSSARTRLEHKAATKPVATSASEVPKAIAKPVGGAEATELGQKLSAKEQARAKKLQEVEAREKLMKGMDRERWETRMKGKAHVDSEALKRQWAEEDAAEQREVDQTAANARIEQIINAKKFQLGSRAVERGKLDDELYKDAIAQAAREGHNVEHLFEDNDSELYRGKHRLDDKRPNYIPEEAWTKLTDEERHEYAEADVLEQTASELKRPDAISQEQWDELSDEEKRNLVAYEASLRGEPGADEPEIATGVAIDAEGSDPEKPSWKNPKERVLYLMRKAQANLWTLSKDSEKDRQRRKVAGWVAGGIAVAAAAGLAYLEIKGHSVSHAHNPNNTGSGPTGGGAGTGTGEHIHTVTLKRGSNPWEVSRHQLELHGNSHPTDAQILAYDKKLGQANGYKSWHAWVKAARHLMPRMKLKLPK